MKRYRHRPRSIAAGWPLAFSLGRRAAAAAAGGVRTRPRARPAAARRRHHRHHHRRPLEPVLEGRGRHRPEAEAEKLGYKTTVDAHLNDPDKQNQFIDGAISKKVKAIILDPAGADESVGAVQKADRRGHPGVPRQRRDQPAGHRQERRSSPTTPRARPSAPRSGPRQMGGKGTYVELFGNPTDNNAQVRSDGYKAVLSQYPDLKLAPERDRELGSSAGQGQDGDHASARTLTSPV